MATAAPDVLEYDHHLPNHDPHGIFKRLRAEDPMHQHGTFGYWVMTRYDDIQEALTDTGTYSSAKGDTLEFIMNNTEIPPGALIFEDPPTHTMRRSLLMRMFKPKRIANLEAMIRDYCRRTLDPLVEQGEFDVIKELSHTVPMRVIGMLLGMPEEIQEEIRAKLSGGQPMVDGVKDYSSVALFDFGILSEYLDWRLKNPSDDLITEMMGAEFTDEKGVKRTLTTMEMQLIANLLASAGNETTGRMIGWIAKLMPDYPDQRQEVASNPKLAAAAIEEIMRYEPTSLQICRSTTRDVEKYGKVMPAGSALILATASANRDEAVFENPDTFDIHRKSIQNLTLGYGPHFCLGAALTKLEGRIVLEEMLKRMPNWTVDLGTAEITTDTAFHGWDKLMLRANV